MNQFIEGFVLQASLILALGAQNIFVLESGLKKERHFLVATLCSFYDVILITIGVLGAASIFIAVPLLKIGFGILGVFFLIFYGIKKFIEGFKSTHHSNPNVSTKNSLKKTIMLSLGFSLLNPHVYLDTLVLVGGYAAKFTSITERIQFGAGAGTLSVIWFFSLVCFASYMSALLNNPKSMRIVSIISGLILIVLSVKLGIDVYGWITL